MVIAHCRWLVASSSHKSTQLRFHWWRPWTTMRSRASFAQASKTIYSVSAVLWTDCAIHELHWYFAEGMAKPHYAMKLNVLPQFVDIKALSIQISVREVLWPSDIWNTAKAPPIKHIQSARSRGGARFRRHTVGWTWWVDLIDVRYNSSFVCILISVWDYSEWLSRTKANRAYEIWRVVSSFACLLGRMFDSM